MEGHLAGVCAHRQLEALVAVVILVINSRRVAGNSNKREGRVSQEKTPCV